MRKIERPKIKESANGKEQTFSHPAFGVMRVTEPSGGGRNLFGSDVPHDQYIEIEIVEATMRRSLSYTEYFGKHRPIVKFAMSHAQLHSMLSGVSKYSGIPITFNVKPIKGTQTEYVSAIEGVSSSIDMAKDEFARMLKDDVNEALAIIAELTLLMEMKQQPTKQVQLLTRAKNKIANLPFGLQDVVNQAELSMDKFKNDAISEVEAKIASTINNIGLMNLPEYKAATYKGIETSDIDLHNSKIGNNNHGES